MPLPLGSAPASTDVVVLDWAGVTVRVAWTLLRLGIRVRPTVLEEARLHVILHLDASMPATAAEDLAEHLTEEFVARAKGTRPSDPWPQDWNMPLSDRWRRAVEASLHGDARTVFLKHYGDNRSLTHLSNLLMIDVVTLEAAQEGLRHVIRELARADRLPIRDWPESRIDRLLRRLASYAPGPCPRPVDVMEGYAREHTRSCPRCNRLARLVQSHILTAHQLVPPTSGLGRPREHVRVLALQIHPDGHAFRRALVAELPTLAFPIGDDLLLLDYEQVEAIGAALRVAAEVGSPQAHHLRGALLEGKGTWGEHGLAGPLPGKALEAVSNQVWGVVTGVPELPDELPVAPSATGLWMGVGGLLAVSLLLLRLAATQPTVGPTGDLAVEFLTARQGTWAQFVVPDTTWVSVVAHGEDGLVVVLDSRSAADKMALAVGDGTYRTHVPGRGLLVAAHEGPIDLPKLVAEASAHPEPLVELRRLLSAHAEVQLHQRS